jgi:transcription-repair coupling factor (superfamily II helicase)
MTALDEFFAGPHRPAGRLALCGAPEGHDARVLGELVARGVVGTLLHVCRDDGRMARMAAALAFFHDDVPVLTLPAWDCLPYDRVSPNGEIVSRRIDTLTRLVDDGATGRRIVLTTVNALVQRVPPRKLFEGRSILVGVGGRMPTDRLISYLQQNGYQRSETVREAGEYAVRGGIVDVFPAGSPEPLRLDFFGDAIESIRRFDALSQRSTGTVESASLKPVSEVLLEPQAIQRFRSRYREAFGTVSDDDPLYAAVSAGHRYAGMEHWLPFYYETLETIFDYVPGAAVSLDHQTEEVRADRLAGIADFYGARRSLLKSRQSEKQSSAPVYRPVPPEQLFLGDAEWADALAARRVAELSPFAAPPATSLAHDAGGRRGRDFAEARANPQRNLFEAVRDALAEEGRAGRRAAVAAYSAGSAERLKTLLAERGLSELTAVTRWQDLTALPLRAVGMLVLGLETGYSTPDFTLVTEQDILGDRLSRPARRRPNVDQFITEVSTLLPGDLVVHVEHGIGRYDGLVTLDVAGAPHDCLRIIYAGDDKLFVPVENIEVLSRYGSEAAGAVLDRLGGVAWQSRKARVKERIKEIASQLIAVAAARQLRQGEALPAPEGLYEEFAARFPYPETEDQLRAIADTLGDMASGRPMDRLVCGDVGFGKTEVALRAAFIAAMQGTQVAVVVPTTLLARQHHRSFTQRFAGLPLRIAQLSRLVGARDAAAIKQELAEGRIDIVIGTHALLAKGVSFAHLGLLVVDEEQHFGVAQKERLKQLKANVHVLTLTATPIPRTLQMALAGVKEMSIIATPPIDRLAVRTFVMPYDPVVIREAILREHHRGGQTFYVTPRIADLEDLRLDLKALVPEIKVGVAHGRMASSELEKVMGAFDDGAFDVLLSTDIIESGLDIPTANTLVVNRSDMFGLAQLYQLRGRVGRGKQRAYAYLTLPAGKTLTASAQRRLEVMQTLDTLGAGFTLASHDMDIRGAGNLLGEEQSGHIREVGIELYQQLLEEAVTATRTGVAAPAEAPEEWTPQITIGMPVLIPEGYVADLNVRLGLYRRVATLLDQREIDAFAAELVDRFGPLPPEVENLLDIIAIKRLCRAAGIEKVEAGPKGAVLSFRENRFANPLGLVEFLQAQAGTAKLRTDQKLLIMRAWENAKDRLVGVRHLLEKLSGIAAQSPPEQVTKAPAKAAR